VYLLAIDQGTSSTRAMLFDVTGKLIESAQQELSCSYPQSGWVEQDPELIWQSVLDTVKSVLAKTDPKKIHGIGICNQRETTILWDKQTGAAVHPAIVWQDRRTAEQCAAWQQNEEFNALVAERTGLLLDPYFSASKLHWLFSNNPDLKQRAENGEIAFGTVDSFLLWRLSGGKVHATDASNAARTLLFDINKCCWDKDLLSKFSIPEHILPAVKDNATLFATTSADVLGAEIPITAMAGDQQAAAFGQCCFESGMLKSTYGTGCFMLANTGDTILRSKNKLLSTVLWRLNNKTTYAIEGSIFVAGAAVQWLRDALKIISDAKETESVIKDLHDNGGVYLVPAFTGLGAPYWDPDARGALLGLTRDTGVRHIVRAALESVCYQSLDLLAAMQADGLRMRDGIRVDGGMANNKTCMQILSDVLQHDVHVPRLVETSAWGAAALAGLGAGVYNSLSEISALRQSAQTFSPQWDSATSSKYHSGWKDAVARALS
jgi:glycerol kinase